MVSSLVKTADSWLRTAWVLGQSGQSLLRQSVLVVQWVKDNMAGKAKEVRDEWEIKLISAVEELNIAATTAPTNKQDGE